MALEEQAHCATIQAAIALGSRSPHGRALAAIEHSELERREIGGATHDPTEGVDFADHRTLRDASDSRVARHLTDALERTRYEANAGTETRGCYRRFGPSMACTDDEDIEIIFNQS